MRDQWVTILVLVVVVGLAVSLGLRPEPCVDPRSDHARSKDNIRTLIVLMLVRRIDKDAAWPAHSGRNFILSLVARDQLDRRNAKNLEILWPPSMRAQFAALDPRAYDEVTLANLKTRRFPHLTGYAGRQDPITRAEEKKGTPLIGDLTSGDGAIIGYSNGAVRFLERDELGLDDNDPIVAGPTSKSPILRMLSDD